MKLRLATASGNACDIMIDAQSSHGDFTHARAEWENYPPSETDLRDYNAAIQRLIERLTGANLQAIEIAPHTDYSRVGKGDKP